MRRACGVLILLVACGQDHDAQMPVIDATIDDAADASLPIEGCHTSADCKETEFCDNGPSCGGVGTCAPLGPPLCSDLGFWVCGCDGVTYTNMCHSASVGTAVAYGGPCRPAGQLVGCQTSDDCPFDAEFPQYCVDDPRDACDPASGVCPGICVHGTYVCGATLPCLSQTQHALQESFGTEVCMTVTPGSNPDPDVPGRCIYTTRQTCASSADCGTGELCMPELGCDPATTSCPSDCVRP